MIEFIEEPKPRLTFKNFMISLVGFLFALLVSVIIFQWAHLIEIEEGYDSIKLSIEEQRVISEAQKVIDKRLAEYNPSFPSDNTTKVTVSAPWGVVWIEILNNYYHKNAVVIHKIEHPDGVFGIKQALDGDYNAYFKEGCKNLKMGYLISHPVNNNLEDVEPVFGVNRNETFRQIFHLAEIAIKN